MLAFKTLHAYYYTANGTDCMDICRIYTQGNVTILECLKFLSRYCYAKICCYMQIKYDAN